MTHVPETGDRKMEMIYGAGFWSVCHGPWVLSLTINVLYCVLHGVRVDGGWGVEPPPAKFFKLRHAFYSFSPRGCRLSPWSRFLATSSFHNANA